jgi:hypothetical protein
MACLAAAVVALRVCERQAMFHRTDVHKRLFASDTSSCQTRLKDANSSICEVAVATSTGPCMDNITPACLQVI